MKVLWFLVAAGAAGYVLTRSSSASASGLPPSDLERQMGVFGGALLGRNDAPVQTTQQTDKFGATWTVSTWKPREGQVLVLARFDSSAWVTFVQDQATGRRQLRAVATGESGDKGLLAMQRIKEAWILG